MTSLGGLFRRPSPCAARARKLPPAIYRWAIHRADGLNHYTHPRKGKHWCRTLCFYDSTLLAAEAGWTGAPGWRGAFQLARQTKRRFPPSRNDTESSR